MGRIFLTFLFLLTAACRSYPLKTDMSDAAISKRQTRCRAERYTKTPALLWLTLPVRVSVSEELPAEAYPVLDRAIKRWNQQTGLKLFELNPEKPSILILWQANKLSQSALQVAQARLRFYEPLLLRVEIELFQPANFSFSETKEDYKPDLEATLIHELGHALGLEHTTGVGTMAPESDLGMAEREIDERSVQAVLCLYR